MALTAATTIASAMLVSDQFVTVTSATGLAAGMLMRVDNEYMTVGRDYVSGTVVPLTRRGDQGSRQVPHNALAPCIAGYTSDYTDLATYALVMTPPYQPGSEGYSVSGAITVPKRNSVIVLDKAGVAVMTLAAPGVDQDGLRLTIRSTTAQAHTITCPSAIIMDGASGSPHTVITFTTGFKGQGCELLALQGFWHLVSNTATTIT